MIRGLSVIIIGGRLFRQISSLRVIVPACTSTFVPAERLVLYLEADEPGWKTRCVRNRDRTRFASYPGWASRTLARKAPKPSSSITIVSNSTWLIPFTWMINQQRGLLFEHLIGPLESGPHLKFTCFRA